ncbi:MAG: tagaturonate reductase [Cyclobacteriaceae bacterium]|nr:tagaturonate reductase [Cyclobacteriaceae bacterium]
MKKLNRQNAGITQQHPVKILQFGEGNFLRAFVDWMVDVMNEHAGFNGSVQIIQPLAGGMGSLINEQDGLYHVILNGIRNGKSFSETRLITCVTGVVNPYEDFRGFLKTAENPDLKFVISNTTEAGIAFDENDKSVEVLPRSFPGKLTLLLHHRFQFFNGDPQKALTLIPCELIDKNGTELKKVILQYIQLWNLPGDFRQWIENHTTFCNTLVDRIVPGFPKETIGEIQQQLGYEDNLIVTAEPFHLWVIEAPERLRELLPAHKAGLDVKFVSDQSPYRTRKVRILNGAHTAMVPVAYLHGVRTVREAVDDTYIGRFIRETIAEEIIPTLDLPDDELKQFANDVIERFQNPFIKHELITIALNSISKYKVRVLPSVLEYINRKKTLPKRLVHSLAALICFYKGTWNNVSIPLNDSPEVLNFAKETWSSSSIQEIATKFLSNISFWDQDLTKINGLTDLVVVEMEKLISSQKS